MLSAADDSESSADVIMLEFGLFDDDGWKFEFRLSTWGGWVKSLSSAVAFGTAATCSN